MDLSTIPIKKVAAGAAILIVAGAAGFGIYYLFFRAEAPAPPTNEVVNEIGGLPGIPTEPPTNQIINGVPVNALPPTAALPKTVTKITVPEETVSRIAQGGVTRVSTTFANISTDMAIPEGGNNPVTYNKADGYFYQVDNLGNLTKLTSARYPNVDNISWSPDTTKAILEFPDGSNVMYDFRSQKQVTLPKSWQDFEFNDTGSKIAFKDINAQLDYNWLATANPDGSQQKYIEELLDKSDRVQTNWSKSGHVVATYYKAQDSTSSAIHLVGQNNENYRAITSNGFGVQSTWVPDGRRMVYNAYSFDNNNKPMLYIVDAYGDRVGYNHNSLGINTWVDKCTFQGEDTMYCAVPKYLPDHAGFQPSVADDIPDYIYKVDLKSGAKAIIAEPELTYTIDSMEVSDDGKYLYFTDKATQNIHYIQLQ